MAEASSLTQQLRLLRNNSPSSGGSGESSSSSSSPSSSVLFSRQSSSPSSAQHDNLTYEQCWQIVDEHRQWLKRTVDYQAQRAVASGSDVKVKDVIVGYLADNSPDLLLSLLACIDLTNTSSTTAFTQTGGGGEQPSALHSQNHVLPAMINGRWTPLEIERALRPSSSSAVNHTKRGKEGDAHVTIILYGEAYEHTAKESVRIMNQSKNQMHEQIGDAASHFAVALPLPKLAERSRLQTTKTSSPRQSSNQQHTLTKISNSDAILLFTSGTSSPRGAKGVRLSHRSLLIQAYAKTHFPCNYSSQTNVVATTVPWFHVGGISSALAVVLAGGCLVFPPDTSTKGFQPGLVLQSMQSPKQPSLAKREEVAVSSASSSFKVANTLVVVPAMLHAMVEYSKSNMKRTNNQNINHSNHNTNNKNQQQSSPTSYPNVRLILVGGQSIGNGKLLHQTRQLFPKARIVQTYACTEAGSSITFEDLGWPDSNGDGGGMSMSYEKYPIASNLNDGGATCVGLPPSHIQIAIFDSNILNTAANNNHHCKYVPQPPLLHGRMGIIATRGPHVMSSYWNRSDDNPTNNNNTRASSPSLIDGWMFTNDLGYIHPQTGKLYFCGRANDVIRTGGESVLANEVERVLETHKYIKECAVFALPDEKFGEAVCAALVLEERAVKKYDDTIVEAGVGEGSVGVVVESEQWTKLIREYCAERQLAGFKRPRRVFCMLQALPRNSSGKVLKHEIIRLCATCSKETSRL